MEQVLGKLHTCLNRNTNRSNQGIQTGDVVKASIDASGAIVGYVNGVEVIRAMDTTYPEGNPAIGFWLSARSGLLRGGQGRGTNADFGFSSFSGTDGCSGVMNAEGRRANRIALGSLTA